MSNDRAPTLGEKLRTAWRIIIGQHDDVVRSLSRPVVKGSSIRTQDKLIDKILSFRSQLIQSDWQFNPSLYELSEELLSHHLLVEKELDWGLLERKTKGRFVESNALEFAGILLHVAKKSWTAQGSEEAIKASNECLKWIRVLQVPMNSDWIISFIRLINEAHWKQPCCHWMLQTLESVGPLKKAEGQEWVDVIERVSWVLPEVVNRYHPSRQGVFDMQINICSFFVFPNTPLSADDIDRVENTFIEDRDELEGLRNAFSSHSEKGHWSWRSVAISVIESTLVTNRNSYLIQDNSDLAKNVFEQFRANLDRLELSEVIVEPGSRDHRPPKMRL